MSTSIKLTMFGCFNSFNKDISRIAVDGTPSSSVSKRIFFIATISPVFLCLPLYTTPYVPIKVFQNYYYFFFFNLFCFFLSIVDLDQHVNKTRITNRIFFSPSPIFSILMKLSMIAQVLLELLLLLLLLIVLTVLREKRPSRFFFFFSFNQRFVVCTQTVKIQTDCMC